MLPSFFAFFPESFLSLFRNLDICYSRILFILIFLDKERLEKNLLKIFAGFFAFYFESFLSLFLGILVSLIDSWYFKGTKFRGWVGINLIFAGIKFRGWTDEGKDNPKLVKNFRNIFKISNILISKNIIYKENTNIVSLMFQFPKTFKHKNINFTKKKILRSAKNEKFCGN